eukprot:SAG11_NODE_17150_length_527_cov_0.665888_1_plen_157_part_10
MAALDALQVERSQAELEAKLLAREDALTKQKLRAARLMVGRSVARRRDLIFVVWRLLARRKRVLTKALHRLHDGILGQAFEAWGERTAVGKRQHFVVRQAARRMVQRLGALAFEQWSRLVRQLKRSKRIVERMSSNRQAVDIGSCFSQWIEWASTQK